MLSGGPTGLPPQWMDISVWKKWLQDRDLHQKDKGRNRKRIESQAGSPVSSPASPSVTASSPQPSRTSEKERAAQSRINSTSATRAVVPTPPSSQPLSELPSIGNMGGASTQASYTEDSQDITDIERIPERQVSVLDMSQSAPSVDEIGIEETMLVATALANSPDHETIPKPVVSSVNGRAHGQGKRDSKRLPNPLINTEKSKNANSLKRRRPLAELDTNTTTGTPSTDRGVNKRAIKRTAHSSLRPEYSRYH
ncbi:hypothetical protein LTR93_012256 [Exophiala xenobiotica]|nr:hypothetical protein LTR93_012256 [Exophiala xenobiotica]